MTNWCKSYRVIPEPLSPHEFIPASEPASPPAPQNQRNLMVYTIHDGDIIPSCFWEALSHNPDLRQKQIQEIDKHYVIERDWGANAIAEALSEALNQRGYFCPGYFRINIARVLMDYGRFPGNTPPEAAHLERFAINYPFSRILDYERKKLLLESYYDNISDRFEELVVQKNITIAIHTYDKYNQTGTERPLMSILTRPLGYQTKSAMPLDFFDPLYPAVLCEGTADRKLTYRLSLMLEKENFSIAHNYPYNLPDGSIEVRSQVWFFFQYLRTRFEEEYPDSRNDRAYQQVWQMLLDTNLRSTESENLRSYLHMFRKAPRGEAEAYQAAHNAYKEIRRFLEREDHEIVKEYRLSPFRPSSIGIEVRKDYVWDFADKNCRIPIGPKPENAHKVGTVIAQALISYFENDADTPAF